MVGPVDGGGVQYGELLKAGFVCARRQKSALYDATLYTSFLFLNCI